MATRQRLFDRGTEHGRALRIRAGHELREARIGLGLSLAEVGRATRLSEGQVSRIERGLVVRVSLEDLARLHVVVGLELSMRSFPSGQPIRDAAHVQLLSEFRSRLHRSLAWAVEVPLPTRGDPRAWDGLIRGPDFRYGVEAETAPRDAQALVRRILAKERDGEVDGAILLVRATLQTRRFLGEAGDWLASSFPVEGSRALELLAAGVAPGGNAVVVLPPRRRRTGLAGTAS
jgi:transcriptional regulator with XRE-family HTH domain